MLAIKKLIKISRPRFRLYTGGPFLIGVAETGLFQELHRNYISYMADNNTFAIMTISLIVLIFLAMLDYFVFAGNLLIYGVNDIADSDTDIHNDKKGQYEELLMEQEKVKLASSIKKLTIADLLIILVLFVALLGMQSKLNTGSYREGSLGLLGEYIAQHGRQLLLLFPLFFFFSIYYSAYPIRAKARPFLDGFFNILYIIPGLIGYVMFGGSLGSVNWLAFLGALLWCMAMHNYSAIPDIHADKKAGLETTAIHLGRTNAIHYSAGLWTLAAIILFTVIGWPAILFWIPYAIMSGLSFSKPIFKLYKYFPWINAAVGFALFWFVLF